MGHGRTITLQDIAASLTWSRLSSFQKERIWWDDFCWAWHEIGMSAVLSKLDIKGVEW